MYERWLKYFIRVGAWSFSLTGIAKLISATGSAAAGEAIFGYRDPIFGITFRLLFLLAGLAEIGIALYCFLGRDRQRILWVIAIFATSLALYRFGVWILDYHTPCTCLGTLTDKLHIDPFLADRAVKLLLGLLLVNSYLLVVFHRNSVQKLSG